MLVTRRWFFGLSAGALSCWGGLFRSFQAVESEWLVSFVGVSPMSVKRFADGSVDCSWNGRSFLCCDDEQGWKVFTGDHGSACRLRFLPEGSLEIDWIALFETDPDCH
jgi:hypothetical protein